MKLASTLAVIMTVALALPMQRSLAADDLALGDAAAIAAAIASPDRPRADVEQDARRKPQQVLEFAATTPSCWPVRSGRKGRSSPTTTRPMRSSPRRVSRPVTTAIACRTSGR